MATSRLSRFQGSLVGGVLGDCIGAVFEGQWDSIVHIHKIKEAVDVIESDDKLADNSPDDAKSGKKRRTEYYFTDDTAMARSISKSLIQNRKLDVTDMAKKFTEEFMKEKNRGYGSGVVTVFDKLFKTKYTDVFGPAAEQFDGKGSYGNGGAMRIAPAALFAAQKDLSFDELVKLCESITRITHTHLHAIHGAILQCYAVYLALNTEQLDVNSYLDELISKMKTLEETSKETIQASGESENNGEKAGESDVNTSLPYCQKLEKIRKFVNSEEQPAVSEINEHLGVYIAALDSVPAAIYCFLRATKPIEGLQERNEFERTIMYAIHHGGDTDTVATMAGAIAGAYYGLDIIPLSWRYGCEGVDIALKDAELMTNLK